jgi:ectoine hydroxylase-related dioxygenase (phytanoyl-CoA dioxygenase family)
MRNSARLSDGRLDPRSVTFFETFGYLHLAGYFADDIADIGAAFDEVVARTEVSAAANNEEMFGALAVGRAVTIHHELNFGTARRIVPQILDLDDRLGALKTDPRILSLVDALLPESHYSGSDGNIFDGDTGWHCDLYGSPIGRNAIKFFFYLDPLDAESGALRIVPGTSHYESPFAEGVRKHLSGNDRIEKTYGISWKDVPAVIVNTQPGDLVVGDLRNMHATVNGRPGRRMFAFTFSEADTDAQG